MQQLRKTIKESKFTSALLVLFGLHFLTVHGVVQNLIYCFEESGQVSIESEVGSIFTIPSEDVIHAKDLQNSNKANLNWSGESHFDFPFSLICSKEQRSTSFNQQRALQFLDGTLNTKIEQLAPSRVFQFVSFIPPLIEDVITTSLQTVVLIN